MNKQSPYYTEQNLNSQQSAQPIKIAQNQKAYGAQGVKPKIQTVQYYPPQNQQPQLTTTVPSQNTPCPFCHQQAKMIPGKKTGSTIWIWCLGLTFLVGCCWIPFCIDDCYDQVLTCSSCNATRHVTKSRYGCC